MIISIQEMTLLFVNKLTICIRIERLLVNIIEGLVMFGSVQESNVCPWPNAALRLS